MAPQNFGIAPPEEAAAIENSSITKDELESVKKQVDEMLESLVSIKKFLGKINLDSQEETNDNSFVIVATPPQETNENRNVHVATPPQETNENRSVHVATPEETEEITGFHVATPPEKTDENTSVDVATPPEKTDKNRRVHFATPLEMTDENTDVHVATFPEKTDENTDIHVATPPEKTDENTSVEEEEEETTDKDSVDVATPSETTDDNSSVHVAPPSEKTDENTSDEEEEETTDKDSEDEATIEEFARFCVPVPLTSAEHKLSRAIKRETAVLAIRKAQTMMDFPLEVAGYSVRTNDAEVILEKRSRTEVITITFNVNYSVDKDVIARPDFEINIYRRSYTLSLKCSFRRPVNFKYDTTDECDGSFGIDEVRCFKGKRTDSTFSVSSEKLNYKLKRHMKSYLDEIGISREFTKKMSDLASFHYHQNFSGLMENLYHFITSRNTVSMKEFSALFRNDIIKLQRSNTP